LWTCLLFPTGSPGRVQDICDLTLLLFATDDAYLDRSLVRSADDACAILDHASVIMRGEGGDPGFPWTAGMRDVWRRFAARMPPRQLRRLVHAIVALYQGASWEVAARLGGTIPDYDAYFRIRKETLGAQIHVIMAEYAVGADLSGQFAGWRDLHALHDTLSEHLILTNDLFSFRKEHFAAEGVNAVSVLHRHRGMRLQQIVDWLCDRISRLEREFVVRRDRMLDTDFGAATDFRNVLEALGYVLSGNLHWSYLTPRYHGAGYVWNGLTSGEVALYPDRTEFLGSRGDSTCDMSGYSPAPRLPVVGSRSEPSGLGRRP